MSGFSAAVRARRRRNRRRSSMRGVSPRFLNSDGDGWAVFFRSHRVGSRSMRRRETWSWGRRTFRMVTRTWGRENWILWTSISVPSGFNTTSRRAGTSRVSSSRRTRKWIRRKTHLPSKAARSHGTDSRKPTASCRGRRGRSCLTPIRGFLLMKPIGHFQLWGGRILPLTTK